MQRTLLKSGSKRTPKILHKLAKFQTKFSLPQNLEIYEWNGRNKLTFIKESKLTKHLDFTSLPHGIEFFTLSLVLVSAVGSGSGWRGVAGGPTELQ